MAALQVKDPSPEARLVNQMNQSDEANQSAFLQPLRKCTQKSNKAFPPPPPLL